MQCGPTGPNTASELKINRSCLRTILLRSEKNSRDIRRFIFNRFSTHCGSEEIWATSHQIRDVEPILLMLAHRLRRWFNINPALVERLLRADTERGSELFPDCSRRSCRTRPACLHDNPEISVPIPGCVISKRTLCTLTLCRLNVGPVS